VTDAVPPKARLFAPGPVAVDPDVLAALAQPVVHHRTSSFRAAFLRVREALADVAEVPGDDVLLVSGSGTSAFEGALLAAVPRGGAVVALTGGKFGERWADLARRFGYAVREVDAPWGRTFDPQAVVDAVRAGPSPDAVTVVHSETSTGVLHDVAAIAAAVRSVAPDALVLVDAVTSLAAAELRPHAWGLDAVVSGSQKGVQLPPGLGFAWLSERAWVRAADPAVRVPTFALDLHGERPRQRGGDTGATPPTSLVVAADVGLARLRAEPSEARWARKARLNAALLAAGAAAGARPFAERPSPAVAALETPAGIDAERVVKALAARGVRVAGGQDRLKGRVLRPSALGDVDGYDVVLLAAALEDAFRSVGMAVPYGAAAGAALAALDAPA
jgi:aspartate aminotransferase-like enzyme